MKDYFELLGVDENTSIEDIELKYRKMADKPGQDPYPGYREDLHTGYTLLTDQNHREACISFHRMSDASKEAYRLAEMAIDEKNYAGAIKLLDKTIKTEENPDHLYYLLGYASARAEKYPKAIKAYGQLISKYPHDLVLLESYAWSLYDNGNFKKAMEAAAAGYEQHKDRFSLLLVLANSLIHLKKSSKAFQILSEAMENESLQKYLDEIYPLLVLSAFYSENFQASLEYMEKLTEIDLHFNECDIVSISSLFLDMFGFYSENEMYEEALRCIKCIITLLPDNPDIVQQKLQLEKAIKHEDLFHQLETDESIPGEIIEMVAAELFPTEAAYMTKEQKAAYTFVQEYYFLENAGQLLMPLRYFKNKYPELYKFKETFFDDAQDAKKRRILITKYKAEIPKYQGAFNDLMEEWEDEYGAGPGEGYEDWEGDGDWDRHSFTIEDAQSTDPDQGKVLPFIRNKPKSGNND